MIKHLFKLIWKKRKSTRLLLFEFFMSFFLIFIILSVVCWFSYNSNMPLGFKYDNVYGLLVEFEKEFQTEDNKYTRHDVIEYIKTIPGVISVTQQRKNHPYVLSYSHTTFCQYNKEKNFEPRIFGVDEHFAEVFKPTLVSGRFFNESDLANKYAPAVITSKLKRNMFGDRKAEGKVIDAMYKEKFIITGVIDEYRHIGDFSNSIEGLLVYRSERDSLPFENRTMSNINTNFGMYDKEIYVRAEKMSFEFEAKLSKLISRNFPNIRVSIDSLAESKKSYYKRTWIPILTISIICGFLFINVLIGLFGQLWYNINLRKAEIGLRMALGGTKSDVYKLFLGEMIILTLLGIIPSIIIALQFPLLNVFGFESIIYFTAIILSTILMLILIIICCVFPARQASKLQPAVALHEE